MQLSYDIERFTVGALFFVSLFSRSQSFGSLVAEFRTSSSNSQLSLPDLDLLATNVEENNNDFKIDVPDIDFADGKVGK